MRAVLRVSVLLMPLPLLLAAAGRGYPAAGAAAGLAWALVAAALMGGLARMSAFQMGLVGGLAAALGGYLGGVIERPAAGEALLMTGLALGASASLLQGRPWTAAFSAGDYGGAAGTPLFHDVNMLISGLWAAVFAWLALASGIDLAPALQWGPLAMASLASIVLPPVLMRRGLRRMISGGAGSWSAPGLGRMRAGDIECDVAVIGSGIGGLTAAALLADAGVRVEVFEQHEVPGGFAHTWVRRARARDPQTGEPVVFRFDSGVHDVSGWQEGGTVRTLFERLGIAHTEEWARLDHRYVLDGCSIDVPRDWRQYRDLLTTEFPRQATGIRALFEDVHTIYRSMFATQSHWGGFPGMPGTPREVLAFADAHPLAAAWMDRPWHELVHRHVRDPAVLRWINALSGYVGDDAGRLLVRDMAPIYGFYFEGGHYPIGGSGQMTSRLVEAIESRGGIMHLRQTVTRVMTTGGAASGIVVRAFDGAERTVRSRAVVCNADIQTLEQRLLAGDGTAAGGLRRQTGHLTPACSAVGVCLGLRGRLDLPPVVHIDGPDGFAAMVVPSVVDPSAAPPGYSTLEILELLPAGKARAWFPPQTAAQAPDYRQWRREADYLARKQAAGDALIARARAVIPDLDQRIVYRTEASPVTYHRYAHTSNGSIYGVRGARGPIPVKTAVPNLVLAGSATHGPGIEAVVISGAFAAEALLPGLLARRAGGQLQPSAEISS